MHVDPSDKEVITRVLQGEQKAYEVLVTRYQSFVFTMAYRYTRNREDAEELAQSAFVHASVFEVADRVDSGMRANIVEEKSKIQLVNDAIALLKPDDAKVLTLFYKGDQSLEEIGLIMGIEPNNAKVKLHRARQRLKEKMQQYFAVEVEEYIQS